MTDRFDAAEVISAVSHPIRMAVLVTCFNRRETTLQCLRVLSAQEIPGCEVDVFVVDDASSDGTAAAIAESFPRAKVYSGNGSLFWNRGMHRAFELAMVEDFDYYLWLNDDTVLLDGALRNLLCTAETLKRRGVDSVVVGNTFNPVSGRHTYGGVMKGSGLRPGAFRLAIADASEIKPCDTMHGNCTLIPRAVAERVGNLDGTFQHNFGDLDYGLRTRSAGLAIHMAPGLSGTCSENSDAGTWKDRSLSLRRRWSLMQRPKGCPWPDWVQFTRQHFGPLWFLYAVSPYLRLLGESLRRGKGDSV